MKGADLVHFTADGVNGAGLWQIPEGNAPLQQRAELQVQASRVRALAWHPERPDSAVTVEERSVVQWRFEGSSAEVRPICAIAAQKDSKESLSDVIHSHSQDGRWVQHKPVRPGASKGWSGIWQDRCTVEGLLCAGHCTVDGEC